jgi:nicotinamidase/pyrazinamidase
VTDYDFFVWKGIEPDLHPYGICYHDFAEKLSTGLIEFLHASHIRVVIIGGLATDYCVKVSVLQLCQAGFQVWVNLAACRGLDEQTMALAIERMEAVGARMFMSSAQMLEQFPELK